MPSADTIAAIATAPGRAGIGVVRVSGPGVIGVMHGVLGRELAARTVHLADFLDADGSVLDQGVAIYFSRPHSYTGEDVLELQGHGGPAVLRLILKRCLALGARIAEPGEFTRRAFVNDKLDLAQAEAVADLIEASTEQAARGAARSLKGELSRIVAGLQRQLTELRALLEATLDFPDEEVDAIHHIDARARLDRLLAAARDALRAARQGCLLRDGLTVVLAGPPNVGKSSIINALSGEDVAIVTPIPGTTRDLVKQSVEIRGVPVHIVDTAGVREARDLVEELGIARTWESIGHADLVVMVSDVTVSEPGELARIEANLPARARWIRVHNKIDLVGYAPHAESCDGVDHVWISAKDHAGIDLLEDMILKQSGFETLTEGTYLARARHVEALQVCEARLVEAAGHIVQTEIAAEELRYAQRALSELTGEFVADDLLGEIFARFCIWK